MKFNSYVAPFLTDEQFSNSLEVSFSLDNDLGQFLNRIEVIENCCKDKSVIHVGCCDHIPLIKEKINKGTWLHKRLTKISKKTLGIDINVEGIQFLKDLGFDNVICHDLMKDVSEAISSQNWDIMVLGDILEHVDNPVDFLSQLKQKYQGKVDKILITVPNAFDHETFVFASRNVELINTDHRYWFTPYTLAKIGTLAGLNLSEFQLTHDKSRSIGLKAKLKVLPFLQRWRELKMLKKHPLKRSTIVMIFDI